MWPLPRPLRLLAEGGLSLNEVLDTFLEPQLKPPRCLVCGDASLLVGLDDEVAQSEHSRDLAAQSVSNAAR